jgi:hypothetical protein
MEHNGQRLVASYLLRPACPRLLSASPQAQLYGRPELIATDAWAAAMQAVEVLRAAIDDAVEQLQRQGNRLQELRAAQGNVAVYSSLHYSLIASQRQQETMRPTLQTISLKLRATTRLLRAPYSRDTRSRAPLDLQAVNLLLLPGMQPFLVLRTPCCPDTRCSTTARSRRRQALKAAAGKRGTPYESAYIYNSLVKLATSRLDSLRGVSKSAARERRNSSPTAADTSNLLQGLLFLAPIARKGFDDAVMLQAGLLALESDLDRSIARAWSEAEVGHAARPERPILSVGQWRSSLIEALCNE